MAVVDANVEQGLRLAGFSDEQIEQMRAERGEFSQSSEPEDCDVYDDNWDSVMLFKDLATAWTLQTVLAFGPMGGASKLIRTGLPPPNVESELRLQGFPRCRWKALRADLRTMEHAVLRGEAERRAKS